MNHKRVTGATGPIRRTKFTSPLFQPIDVASLVYFRIGFGLIMLWQVWRFFDRDLIGHDYVEPAFHFTYLGFDWVKPWPGIWIYVHFYVLGLLAIFVAVGFLYRISATLFFLGITYVFLLEQATYLNHMYLVSLFSFLLVFLPCHRCLSIDARMRPAIRSETVAAWPLWLLRFQMAVVYFFGGVAKINRDWLEGWPLRLWLANDTDVGIIGPLLDDAWVAIAFSYGGLLIDLLAAPFLLWRRTRLAMFLLLVFFHLLNSRLFGIGIFPWLSIAATLMFFPADWPRRVFNWPRRDPLPGDQSGIPGVQSAAAQRVIVALLATYGLVQVLLPLRHFLYPGNVNWTEEGHRFAWHMKLRGKDAEAMFFLTDPDSGETWAVDPDDELTDRQVSKMAARPYMLLIYAHHLAERAREEGHSQVQVRARVFASLNGRKPRRLIDPEVDLAAQPRAFFTRKTWILPLPEP